MKPACHPLNHIRRGNLPLLTVGFVYGWFAEVEGFEVRIKWRNSSYLLDQAVPPWVAHRDDDIPF